ncbi:MAG: pentapeptide repeat-containing protein [Okeania sp. SIO3C4]|nr:pentapeptide repeat-containing protein [Okeania sp. SIO3B3]NER08661.1 pentapeptide repeat-containing protein [Okeania sp. SIO3C4]
MILHQIATFLLTLHLFLWPTLAQAQYYPPPLSYSNAQLTGKDFSGQVLQSAEFSNANLQLTNFTDADLRGAIFSYSTLTKANLHGADLTYAMADLVDFTNADLTDGVFVETIMLGSTFDGVDITGADFTDALLDGAQIRKLCQQATGVNSKTGMETRYSLGCR